MPFLRTLVHYRTLEDKCVAVDLRWHHCRAFQVAVVHKNTRAGAGSHHTYKWQSLYKTRLSISTCHLCPHTAAVFFHSSLLTTDAVYSSHPTLRTTSLLSLPLSSLGADLASNFIEILYTPNYLVKKCQYNLIRGLTFSPLLSPP